VTRPEKAEAKPSAPSAGISYYVMSTSRSALFRLGCRQGIRMKQNRTPRDTIVILDFGKPIRRKPRYRPVAYGVSLFRRRGFASINAVLGASEAFARGVVTCSHRLKDAHVRIAIGTSNFGRDVRWGHGREWARMVNEANVWAVHRGYGTRIDFAGANDIELSWSGPKATRAWVAGYESVAQHPYYNYGAADACPPKGDCAGAWTLEDVWFVSWGALHAWPLPEIYTPTWSNAHQWYHLAVYSFVHHGVTMQFAGVMSQLGACRKQRDPCHGMNNSPYRAWRQLSFLLNRDQRTRQSIRWVTDIR
jgi:hypothetical protein